MGEDTVVETTEEWLARTQAEFERVKTPGHDQRVLAWKRRWGYEPEPEPHHALAEGLQKRLHQRWTTDRTAARDQLSAENFSAQRRAALGAASGSHYLAGEYGLRTAMDERSQDEQRGIRIDHSASTSYLRDNPAEIAGLFKSLLDASSIPTEDHKDVIFVNSPSVIEKTRVFYGDQLFPKGLCPNKACNHPDASKSQLRAIDPPGACICGTQVLPYPKVTKLADGVYAVQTKPTGKAPTKDVFKAEAKEKEVLASVMKSLGATPSSYQAFKAVNGPSGALKLTDEPTDSAAVAARAGTALAAGVEKLSDDHPMKALGEGATNLLKGIGDLMDAPKMPTLPDAAEKAYPIRRRMIDQIVTQIADARSVDSLAPDFTALDKALTDAAAAAGSGQWDTAMKHLDVAEPIAIKLRKERLTRDPLLANALKQLEAIAAAMPDMAGDTPRFTRLFDLMSDELHIVLSQLKPYSRDSYVDEEKKRVATRIPSLGSYAEGVEVSPHMVSSGMDALTTGMVAAHKAVGTPLSLVDNQANYFETPELLNHASLPKDPKGRVIVASLNPSTPTNPPATFQTVIDDVKGRLSGAPTEKFALVLDITIERETEDGATDADNLFKVPEIKKAIEEGRLLITMCKSYQKYPGLGTGKVMAGTTITVGKTDAFAQGDAFLDEADAGLDFMENDESQLMTHMLATTGGQELELEKRASDNAALLAGMGQSAIAQGKLIQNAGLPFLVTNVKTPALQTASGRSPGMQDILLKMGVEKRDSFGFQNSSCLDIGNGIRINPGQESPSEMTEKFHAVSRLCLDPAAEQERQQRDYKAAMAIFDQQMQAYREADTKYKEDRKRLSNELGAQKAKENPPPKPEAGAGGGPPPPPMAVSFTDEELGLVAPQRPTAPAQVKPVTVGIEHLETALGEDIEKMAKAAFGEKNRKVWSAVLKDRPVEEATLAEKIMIIGQTFKPTYDVSEQDPTKLLESVSYGDVADGTAEDPGLRDINSQIASYLVFAKEVMGGDKGPVDAEIKQLYDAFVQSGMTTVSPEFRARIASDWISMTSAAMPDDPEEAKAVAKQIADVATKLPYREDKAKAMLSATDEAGFAKMPTEAQGAITDACFGTLDLESKFAVLEQLFDAGAETKAVACLIRMRKDVEALKTGGSAMVGTTLADPAAQSEQPLSPSEVAAISDRLDQLERYDPSIAAETRAAVAQAEAEIELAQDLSDVTAVVGNQKASEVRADEIGNRLATIDRLTKALAKALPGLTVHHQLEQIKQLLDQLNAAQSALSAARAQL